MILDYQIPSFEKLLALARACFGTSRRVLGSLRPRTNTLLIGPSGSGKTHLARTVANELGAAFLTVTVSEWILLGCTERGSKNTWPMIFDLLLENYNSDGVVILIDEIDKISYNTSWNQHVRNELHTFCDFQIPMGIKHGDTDPSLAVRQKAEAVLKNRTLILGAGAFQHLWERSSKPNIGFGAGRGDDIRQKEQTNLTHLVETLPRELVNRFRSDLIVLPQLVEADYKRMLEQSAVEVPAYLRETFLRLGYQRIPGALMCQQGCRFVEELVMDTIMEERSMLKSVENLVPDPKLNEKTVAETKESDKVAPEQ